MNAPDAFAAGGRQDDAELIQAGQRWDDLDRRRKAAEAALPDDECEALGAEQGGLMEVINNAQPASLIGCIIKLRVLAHPEIGMEAGERGDDVVSVRQVLAYLEGMAGSAS